MADEPPGDDLERRRRAAAKRSADWYRRRKLGRAIYTLDLVTAEIADLLIENGVLDIADCDEHARVEHALKHFLSLRPQIF